MRSLKICTNNFRYDIRVQFIRYITTLSTPSVRLTHVSPLQFLNWKGLKSRRSSLSQTKAVTLHFFFCPYVATHCTYPKFRSLYSSFFFSLFARSFAASKKSGEFIFVPLSFMCTYYLFALFFPFFMLIFKATLPLHPLHVMH